MLPRLFIKDYKNIDSPKVRNAYGILASIVGIISNVVLSTAKIVLGILFGSVAILADGMNNLSDAGSSIVTMLGFRIANIPPDKSHPFGHARVEYVASLVVAVVILLLGIELIETSIREIVSGGDFTVTVTIMVILAVSILVKIGMFAYYRVYAKKIDSKALKAASVDSLNDAIATSAVLISSIVMYYTNFNLDGFMGLAVAIVIFASGISLFKETISPLLGENPSPEFVKNISDRLHSYEGVLGIHDLVAHNYGPNTYHVSVHVEMSASEDIMVSHAVIDTIERDFKKDGIELVIHLDPVITDDERVDALKLMIREQLNKIDERIMFHDFRVVWREDSKNLIFDIVIPCDMKCSDDEIVNDLENRVREQDPSCYLFVDVDRNYMGGQDDE